MSQPGLDDTQEGLTDLSASDLLGYTGWECRQPFPGIILWRDPHGAHYLVDQTGTRRITGTPHAA